jgi:hypothetical protein
VHVSHPEKVQFLSLNFGVRPFFLPNYKTKIFPSSNFENRSFYLPGRFSNGGFATVTTVLSFSFLFISAKYLKKS